VRGDKLRASKAMQDRTLENKKITVHFNIAVEDAYGESLLEGLHMYSTKTGTSLHLYEVI
jgi:thioredoxin reductase (NADPH)